MASHEVPAVAIPSIVAAPTEVPAVAIPSPAPLVNASMRVHSIVAPVPYASGRMTTRNLGMGKMVKRSKGPEY